MVGVVRGSARAVLAMGVALVVSVTTGGVASAAVAPAVTAEPAAAEAKPDKGPGPKGPKGAPYPKQAERLAAAAKVKQSGPKAGAKGVEVEGMRTATSRTLEDPITGLLSTQLAAESINYQARRGSGSRWTTP